MNDYAKIMKENETIIWEGVPQLKPFFVESLQTIAFGIPFLAFSFFWVSSAVQNGAPIWFSIFGLLFIFTGIKLTFWPPIYALLLYKHVSYLITDKRVIIVGGLIGRDYKIIDFDKIQDISVNVSWCDKAVGNNSGSIILATASGLDLQVKGRNLAQFPRPHQLYCIPDPYGVVELLKKTSHDVKTDINYPNEFRPDTNPGYKTEYKPEYKTEG